MRSIEVVASPRRNATLLLVIVIVMTLLAGCSAVSSMNSSFSGQPEMPTFPIAEPAYNAKLVRDFTAFEGLLSSFDTSKAAQLDEQLAGSSIFDIQVMMDDGQFDSADLVAYYVSRIREFDVDMLNSVMELNPQALEIAEQRDSEREQGAVRGAMHGVPVLLKANIATADRMKTTAGAVAMAEWQPVEDAFLVKRLREAGAIILGKTNLSEWANYMDPSLPNGFSALGGQTRAAYGPYDPLGSSTGSAVSIAAGFATVAVGTETQGSIILPSKVNGVVGLEPSRGLVSGDGIIPLVAWMDTPGPIGRSVTDVAVLLTAMAGSDNRATAGNHIAEMFDMDFTKYLSPDAARGVRVGVVSASAEMFDQIVSAAADDVGHELSAEEAGQVRRFLADLVGDPEAIAKVLNSQGIDTVNIDLLAEESNLRVTDPAQVLEYGFQESFRAFVEDLGDNAPYGSLAEVANFNESDMDNRAPYGQGFVESAVHTDITADEYEEMKEENMRISADALRAFFDNYGVDIIICRSCTQEYAPAGFPALTIPDGYDVSGQPLSLVLIGDYGAEPQLISVGYAYEQAIPPRIEPDLALRMRQIAPVVSGTAAGK